MIFKSCSRRQQARHRPPVPSTAQPLVLFSAARHVHSTSTSYTAKLGTVQVWYISTCIRTVIRVRRRSHNVSTVTVRTLYCTIMGYRTTVVRTVAPRANPKNPFYPCLFSSSHSRTLRLKSHHHHQLLLLIAV
jgi:hypothetical protein